jgi:hypothetical protein
MRFAFEQHFTSAPDDVACAFADPDLYLALQGLPKLGRPEVVGHEVDGATVVLEVRYRFTGELSSAARAVLDPERLTWVERATHEIVNRQVSFTMIPDHYGDRFRCQGGYVFEPDGDGTVRRSEGDLKVRAPLVAGAVERAIISGLQEHLADEVTIVDQFVAGGSTS